jgi:acyl-CoA hydrolase
MENCKLILPQHLNQFGNVFGGYLLQWVDESAWIAATLDFPGCSFVTVGMDKVEFRRGVRVGAVLRIRTEKAREGRTSVQYAVRVFCDGAAGAIAEPIFTTHVTFVRVDEQGSKTPLPARPGNG